MSISRGLNYPTHPKSQRMSKDSKVSQKTWSQGKWGPHNGQCVAWGPGLGKQKKKVDVLML